MIPVPTGVRVWLATGRASLEADWVPDDARKGMHEFMEAAIERRWPGKGVLVKALLRESDRAS